MTCHAKKWHDQIIYLNNVTIRAGPTSAKTKRGNAVKKYIYLPTASIPDNWSDKVVGYHMQDC